MLEQFKVVGTEVTLLATTNALTPAYILTRILTLTLTLNVGSLDCTLSFSGRCS